MKIPKVWKHFLVVSSLTVGYIYSQFQQLPDAERSMRWADLTERLHVAITAITSQPLTTLSEFNHKFQNLDPQVAAKVDQGLLLLGLAVLSKVMSHYFRKRVEAGNAKEAAEEAAAEDADAATEPAGRVAPMNNKKARAQAAKAKKST